MPANDPAAYDSMSTDKMGGDLQKQLDDMVSSAMGSEIVEDTGLEGQEVAGGLPEGLPEPAGDEAGPQVATDAAAVVAEVMAAAPGSPDEFLSSLRNAGYDLEKIGGGPPEAESPPPEIPDDMPMRDARREASERAFNGGAA